MGPDALWLTVRSMPGTTEWACAVTVTVTVFPSTDTLIPGLSRVPSALAAANVCAAGAARLTSPGADVAARTPACAVANARFLACLLYTSPSPRDGLLHRMPSSA